MLSRIEFINICREAIEETRKTLAITNQVDGYMAYHNEIKNNNYLLGVLRPYVWQIKENLATTFAKRHTILKKVGLGNCGELTDYLCVEVANRLQKFGCNARIRKVASASVDHVFLHIRVKLQHEHYSLWEIDAWDPRIIDVTQQPDGKINNACYLAPYGSKVKLIESVWSEDIKPVFFKPCLNKPKRGTPAAGATPPHQLLEKNDCLYSNCTLESAKLKGLIPKSDSAEAPQIVSSWQKI